MAASGARERRPALWPYLVMPLMVLLVFYALHRVHQGEVGAASTPAATAPTPDAAH